MRRLLPERTVPRDVSGKAVGLDLARSTVEGEGLMLAQIAPSASTLEGGALQRCAGG